jgi:hypothetical protein
VGAGTVLPSGAIWDVVNHAWFWGVLGIVALGIAALTLWKLIESAIAAGVKEAVPNLDQLEQKADEVNRDLRALGVRLKLERRDDNLRMDVQMLCGTFIGLMGGFLASWVASGGEVLPDGRLGRAAIVIGIGLALVFVPPLVITPSGVDRVTETVSRSIDWVRRLLRLRRSTQA